MSGSIGGGMARSQAWMGWPFRRIDEDLSILDVIKFGTIDYKLAGLFWLLMENRASVIVAAGPVWAGKTTMLNSMLDFLRPGIEKYPLQGYYEDFKALGSLKPENTYMVAEEISNHQYEYLWGYQVVKAFQHVSKGYAFGATTHARNIKEVAYILNALGVEPEVIARLGVVVTLQVARGKYLDDEPIRYVDTVSTMAITDDGLVAHVLASRHLPAEKLVYPPEETLHKILFNKFAVKYGSISAEIEKRGQILRELDEKRCSHGELRKAIADFYRAPSG
jgi:hypothetical protein